METFQNKISSNISFTDNFLSVILMVRNKIQWFVNYKTTFKNYFSVIKKLQSNSFPITAIFKNGEKIILNSKNEASLYSLLNKNKNFNYFSENDSIILNSPNIKKPIKLYGIKKNFDTILAFKDRTYTKIPLKDHTVVDIGTSIGDTPILFAINGASKIIGLEPFPQNFELAQKNIKENNLEEKITLIMAGCAANDGFQYINPSQESDMRSKIDSHQDGIKIPMISLESIVNKYEISDGILKMDCEGCEYDSILSSHENTLRKFQFIQIEFHFGYKNLQQKLEKSGFKVKITKLESYYKKKKIGFFRGHINAIRQ